MAQPFPIRRAAIYRQRALELTESAKQLRDECDRRHMLDQAATFQRAADAMAPPDEKPDDPQVQTPWRRYVRPGGT
jgi:hypothetical protein